MNDVIRHVHPARVVLVPVPPSAEPEGNRNPTRFWVYLEIPGAHKCGLIGGALYPQKVPSSQGLISTQLLYAEDLRAVGNFLHLTCLSFLNADGISIM